MVAGRNRRRSPRHEKTTQQNKTKTKKHNQHNSEKQQQENKKKKGTIAILHFIFNPFFTLQKSMIHFTHKLLLLSDFFHFVIVIIYLLFSFILYFLFLFGTSSSLKYFLHFIKKNRLFRLFPAIFSFLLSILPSLILTGFSCENLSMITIEAYVCIAGVKKRATRAKNKKYEQRESEKK